MHSPGQEGGLQQVIKTPRKIIGTHLPNRQILGVRCQVHRAQRKLKANTHRSHSLFTPLPAGKKVQKYLLSYHETIEQRHSSGCKTQLIVNSPVRENSVFLKHHKFSTTYISLANLVLYNDN